MTASPAGARAAGAEPTMAERLAAEAAKIIAEARERAAGNAAGNVPDTSWMSPGLRSAAARRKRRLGSFAPHAW